MFKFSKGKGRGWRLIFRSKREFSRAFELFEERRDGLISL